MWEVLGIAITSLNMGFADLPTTAYSYDGEATDISRFYKPSLPTTTVGYTYDTDYFRVDGFVSSGFTTQKLDQLPTVKAVVSHNLNVSDNSYFTVSAGTTVNFGTRNRPCTDSFDRKYYCANLTAYSDFKGDQNASFNNQIGISFTTRW